MGMGSELPGGKLCRTLERSSDHDYGMRQQLSKHTFPLTVQGIARMENCLKDGDVPEFLEALEKKVPTEEDRPFATLPLLFDVITDEAMAGYNLRGVKGKKAMRDSKVFNIIKEKCFSSKALYIATMQKELTKLTGRMYLERQRKRKTVVQPKEDVANKIKLELKEGDIPTIQSRLDSSDPMRTQDNDELPASAAEISRQQLINSPCPICGDKISGFHYGIFSCESCKGFFKRTVPNRRNYLCGRGATCPVTIATRKKCAACRFDKCLKKGMKLEAIRGDRTRGGRSTYQCSRSSSASPLNSPPSKKIRLDN